MSQLWVRQALVLLGLAFLPAMGQAVYLRSKISWQAPAVAPDEVKLAEAEAWGNSVLWVDARPDDQYQADHIPDALQLNEDRWGELLPNFLAAWSPEKRVVVYCSSESCALSHDVARRLRAEAGLKNVFILFNGWEAWVEAKK